MASPTACTPTLYRIDMLDLLPGRRGRLLIQPSQVLVVAVRSPVGHVVRSATGDGHHMVYLYLSASVASRETVSILKIPVKLTPVPVQGFKYLERSTSLAAYLEETAQEVPYRRPRECQCQHGARQGWFSGHCTLSSSGSPGYDGDSGYEEDPVFYEHSAWPNPFSQNRRANDPYVVHDSSDDFRPHHDSPASRPSGSPPKVREVTPQAEEWKPMLEAKKLEPWWPKKDSYMHAEFVQMRRYQEGAPHPVEGGWSALDDECRGDTHDLFTFLNLMAEYWRGKVPHRSYNGWSFFYPYRENPHYT